MATRKRATPRTKKATPRTKKRVVPKGRRVAPKTNRAVQKRKRKKPPSTFVCTSCGRKFRGEGAAWTTHRRKHGGGSAEPLNLAPALDGVASRLEKNTFAHELIAWLKTVKPLKTNAVPPAVEPTRAKNPTRSPFGSFGEGKVRHCPFCPLILPDAVYRDHVRWHDPEKPERRPTFVQGGRIDSNRRRH